VGAGAGGPEDSQCIVHAPMTGSGMMPSRSAMGICCDNSRYIVALGGWSGSEAVDTVYLLDHRRFVQNETAAVLPPATAPDEEATADVTSANILEESDDDSDWATESDDESDLESRAVGWHQRSPLPRPLAYCSAAMDRTGDVYVSGGADGIYQDAVVYTACYRQSYASITCAEEALDVGDTCWSPIADMCIKRCGHASVALPSSHGPQRGSTVAAVGGYTGGMIYQDTIEFYNAEVDRWSLAAATMKYRRSGLAAAVGDAGYIAAVSGAGTGTEINNEDEDFCFAKVPDVGSSPTEASGFGNSIYAVGGSGDGFKGLKQCEHYDLRSGKWHLLANMNVARGYTAACFGGTASPHLLYVSGGVNGHDFCNSVEVYDTRMNTWSLLTSNKVVRAATRFMNGQNQAMYSSHVLHRSSVTVPVLGEGALAERRSYWSHCERDNISRADHGMVFMMR